MVSSSKLSKNWIRAFIFGPLLLAIFLLAFLFALRDLKSGSTPPESKAVKHESTYALNTPLILD
jgi:hypothetical protein